jgi:hypothetical protein
LKKKANLPEPRGRKSRPTILSRTEDFPELCNTGEMKLSANHMK